MKYLSLLAAVAVFALAPDPARAQDFGITITLDENCNGTIANTQETPFPLPCLLTQDNGPSGLAGAMTYNLLNPPGLVVGDLAMFEPGTDFTNLSDLLRFNPDGTAVFYSDFTDGADSLADIGFPATTYPNLQVVEEVGDENLNGFIYTPIAGQPGFVAGAGGPVTYVIQSDTATPEPASAALLLGGAAVLLTRKYLLKRSLR